MTANYDLIPESTRESLDAWIATGRPLGGFCEAVISNDLKEAIGRADDNNLRALFHTVAYLYNYAPISCWGSPEALKSWRGRAE